MSAGQKSDKIIAAIIDSQPIFLNGLSIFLMEHFNQVHVIKSKSITAFSADNPGIRPDLMICGINSVADSNEFQRARSRITRQFPSSKIIVYYDHVSMVVPFAKISHGLLAKKNDISELIECINNVLSGNRYLCNEVI